jgi:hypothetical protein
MKKIKPGECVGKLCGQCDQTAEWRATRLKSLFTKMYACSEHKQAIIDAEPPASHDDHQTEADYQTWMRL